MQEKIIETKICKPCNSSFLITDKDLEFYDKVSPRFPKSHLVPLNKGEVRNEQGDFIKYQIPTPTLCPDCRQQRRLSFRNERNLYKRKCDATGKDIISMYSPDKTYKVYEQSYWWNDESIPFKYGKEFDFTRSFFEQFEELKREVPRLSLHVIGNENCSFVNQCGYSKGCYLSYNTDYSEDCYYCSNVIRSKNCIDLLNADNCELCYRSLDINGCYKCFNVQDCKNCNNVSFSFGLENCNDCFGCTNLRNKKYNIFNEQYSKEDYENEVKKYFNGSLNNSLEISDKFKKHNLKFSRKLNITNCENIVGDNLLNSKNLKYCFDCFSDENLAYCNIVSNGKNIYDFDVGGYDCELNLEVVSSGDKNINCIFCSNIWGSCSNLQYCDVIIGSNNLFGCTGLRNAKYCIFNKQYTKEEYNILVPKIIEHMRKTGEWGEFFPSSISPFGYNESVANEYFPINPPVINDIPLNKGDNGNGVEVGGLFKWSTYEAPFPKVDKIIPANMLPDNISDIPDDILNRAIECEITKKPFKIIRQELDFYRKHNLVIPRRHPDQRHLDRMALRNPRKLFDRKCDKCGKDIKTTYSSDRPEIVYCEDCYNKEIY